ncbi:MAG: SDR family oxidoreductase [Myxococcales bacterium]|nr:SDR family oxidoreductase [Myxococcales bacterium]
MLALELSGRHALVCGASQGIGRAVALELAGLGAEVTALARSETALAALVPRLLEAGAPAARAWVADLDDRASLGSALEGRLADHGPIHIVVNNTGGPAAGPLVEATDDDVLQAIGRHVLAAQLILTRVLPGMRQAGFGRFVQVVSTSVREPIDGLGVSNLTRAAVAGWAKTLSRELPPGITINNVLPGLTDTERLAELMRDRAAKAGHAVEDVQHAWLERVPEGRLADPAEVARVIAFLATEAASYVRGTSIPVDGGLMRSI